MSFDLAVMHVETPLDATQAATTYRSLCTGNSEILKPSERVNQFYEELMTRYPALEELSDDEIDNSPWSVTPEVLGGAVVVCIVWSRAEEMYVYLREHAAEHELLCYDPQEDEVHLPPSLSR